MVRAAVYTTFNQPLEIKNDVEVSPPQAGEIKIKMAASGVCHSDVSVVDGTLLVMPPSVLGHEGAGVVEEIGEGVTEFAPGDHVVISWVPQCGECYFCKRGQGFLCDVGSRSMGGTMLDGTKRLRSGDTELGQMSGTGTFCEYAVVPTIAAVKVDTDLDLKVGALIGCGVLTGVGAALNTANIEKGDAVAVVGCGGVGLNVIQGARIAGATQIIAIDMVDTKLKLAMEFGATDTINAGDGDPVEAVRKLTGDRGADVAFEVIGLQPTIEQAINMTRKGGETVLVGVPRMDVQVAVPAFLGLILQNKTIKGCWYGSSNVQKDVPKLIELYKKGDLKLDELISREIDLAEVNDAFEAMKKGEVARSVIVY